MFQAEYFSVLFPLFYDLNGKYSVILSVDKIMTPKEATEWVKLYYILYVNLTEEVFSYSKILLISNVWSNKVSAKKLVM